MESQQQLALDILRIMYPAVFQRWEEVKQRLTTWGVDTSSHDSVLTVISKDYFRDHINDVIVQSRNKKLNIHVLSYYAYPAMYDAFNMFLIEKKWRYCTVAARFKRLEKVCDSMLWRQHMAAMRRIEGETRDYGDDTN
jgi:phosphoketolase